MDGNRGNPMRWRLILQHIFLALILMASTRSFALQPVAADHRHPEVWQRLYKEDDYVMSIVSAEKRIWGDDSVAIIIDRSDQDLLEKKMAAKACAFFSGKCISGKYIQRSNCATEGSACGRLGRWSFYYLDGKPMQARMESGWPKSGSIPDDMPTNSESVSNQDPFEKAARAFSHYERVPITNNLSILVHDDYKMSWDAMHYWGRGRPDLPLPSMFDAFCEPLSATISLWKGGEVVWSRSFGRKYEKNIEPYDYAYRACTATYMTSVIGQFLVLGDNIFVTTGFENGFVLRFRIRDGYSGKPPASLLAMDTRTLVSAKRALRSEYLKLMETNNILGWEEIPTREDNYRNSANIDYFKTMKIKNKILERRNTNDDPLSTERISKALLEKLLNN